jgi:putative peptidoglycan lipid II flippase
MLITNQVMAAKLISGSVSALSLGVKIIAVVIQVGELSLGTLALPHFSKLMAEKRMDDAVASLISWSVFTLAVSIPIAALMVGFSEHIVELVYQRGAFNRSDTEVVSRIQAFYALQIPFYLVGLLLVKFLYSFTTNRFFVITSTVNLVLNFLLNLMFIEIFGTPGIALSTSTVYFISSIILSLYVLFQLRKLQARSNMSASIANSRSTD